MHHDSCSARPSSEFIEVSVGVKEQTLIYFPGDNDALFLPDDMSAEALRDYLPNPVQRAVLAARLRAFADMLDEPFEAVTS